MTKFYLMDETRSQVRQVLRFKGDMKKLSVDASSWADDNGTVSSAVWSVESGSVSIGTEALSSNVASIILTTSVADKAMIKLVITDGTHSEALYIRIVTKDPTVTARIPDYGMLVC